ncbi:hypothetical protein [Cecembia rubra]|nr:hypothetical protein [Cecembia rubra]
MKYTWEGIKRIIKIIIHQAEIFLRDGNRTANPSMISKNPEA